MNKLTLSLLVSFLVIACTGLTACNKAPDVAPMAPAPIAQSATPDSMSSSPALGNKGAMPSASGASTPAN